MIWFSKADINICTNNYTDHVCFKNAFYKASVNPDPLPTMINITLNIKEVINVNEEDQTITMQMKLMAEWYDNRLDVIRSEDYIEK